ncbi:MAG TPA: ABC transporter permease [Actinomycetes bacterium]|jgi:NitT/TauT family transport system permease protein|nr:ABC transporter permease [Actinomycetes bacterium]
MSGILIPTAVMVVLLLIWQGVVVAFHIPGYLLPAPTTVLRTLFDEWDQLFSQSIPTLLETLAGFAMSIPVGIGLAVLTVASRPIEKAVYPLLVASQVVPKVALAPLFLVWFGFGLLPKILITFLIAFFPIVIETAVGLRSVPVEMLDLARSMGSSRSQVFWRFRFPHALPNIFGGLKVAITLSVIGSIVGEFVGADQGLGYLLTVSIGRLDTALLFAAIVVLVVIGVVLYGVVDFVERATVRWHPSVGEQHGSAIGAA